MDWGTVIQLALAIVGAALIVGGFIAYRGSTRTGTRAFSSSIIAAGVVMWVVVLITVPVSVGEGPLNSPELSDSPLPSLKFDDVNYVYSASVELSSGEVASAINWFSVIAAVFAGLGILGTIFWLWMLVDCATEEPDEGNNKVVWSIIIVFTHLIGAALYFFVRRPRRRAALARG